jgi:hypothetical protein
VLTAGSVRADSIQLTGFSTSAEAGGTRFNYETSVTQASRVEFGDFFIIYDFAGLVPGSLQTPAFYAGTVENLSPPVIGSNGSLLITDNPTVPNLRFTRTDGTVVGPAVLGEFSAVTTLGGQQIGTLGALDTNNSPQGNGLKQVNTDFVPVPVPLPLAAWGGLSLLGLLGGTHLLKSRFPMGA